MVSSDVNTPIEVTEPSAALYIAVVERGGIKALAYEWDKPSVYILLDHQKEDGTWHTYIGKAPAGIRSRVKKQPSDREHWHGAILIKRNTPEGFHSGDVAWLEGRIYDLLSASARTDLHNAVRPGEACALRRCDMNLDSENPTVTIRRRVSTKTGTFAFDTPKTEAGKRTISVPPHLVPIISEHLSEFTSPDDDAIVFTTGLGNPAVDAGARKIKQGLVAIGRPDVRTYDLRHTGQTLAAENGASLRELMHRMGHSSPNASLVYQHRTQDHGRETAKRLSDKANNVYHLKSIKAG